MFINLLFQIATLIAPAGRTGRTPVLTSGTGDGIFVLYPDLTIPVLDTITAVVDKTLNENRSISFSEELIDDLRVHPGDVKICCFFESWKYFWPDYESKLYGITCNEITCNGIESMVNRC